MNSHELARKLLELPDRPVELWVQDSPTSAIMDTCRDVELTEDKKFIQIASWTKVEHE